MNLTISNVKDSFMDISWNSQRTESEYNIYLDGNTICRNFKNTYYRTPVPDNINSIFTVEEIGCGLKDTISFINSLEDLYDAMKKTNGFIDVAMTEKMGIPGFKEYVQLNGCPGDKLRVSVKHNDMEFTTDATLLKDASLMDFDDGFQNIYISGRSDVQSIVKYGNHRSKVSYEHLTDSIYIDGSMLTYGDSCIVGGLKCIVVKGSVVIVLEDSLPQSFPLVGIENEVTQDAGTSASGVQIATRYIHIKNKESSGDTNIESYVYLYDATTDERLGITKIDKIIDENISSGSCSWKTLDPNTKVLEETLSFAPESVNIKCQNSNTENTSIFDTNGISFSNNDAGIFLGSLQQFKIKYENNKVLFQYKSSSGTSYVTKASIER